MLTTTAGRGRTRQVRLRRLGPGRFVADADLAAGPNGLAVVAWTRDRKRLRGEFALHVAP